MSDILLDTHKSESSEKIYDLAFYCYEYRKIYYESITDEFGFETDGSVCMDCQIKRVVSINKKTRKYFNLLNNDQV